MGQNDIDGFIQLKSAVYEIHGGSYVALNEHESKKYLYGYALEKANKEYYERYRELRKKQFQTVGIGILLLLVGILLERAVDYWIWIALTGIAFALAFFGYYHKKKSSLLPLRKITTLTTINYPFLVKQMKRGLIFIDGNASETEEFIFPSYVDNNALLNSLKRLGNAVNTYERLITSNSSEQIRNIHQTQYSRSIFKEKLIEKPIEVDANPFIYATGEKNLKRYRLNVPTITGVSPIVENIISLISNKENISFHEQKLLENDLDAFSQQHSLNFAVSPSQITNWVEGLDSWQEEVLGQDIVEFADIVSDIVSTTGENLNDILEGISKLIQLTIPSNRMTYLEFNNIFFCKPCMETKEYRDKIESLKIDLDLRQWVKERILLGVIDDPIFMTTYDSNTSDDIKEKYNAFPQERTRIQEAVNSLIHDLPVEYVYVQLKDQLPRMKKKGDKFVCKKCSNTTEAIGLPRSMLPLGITYNTVFFENLQKIEQKSDVIVRNVNSFKTTKQQRESSISPLETALINAKRQYVSAYAKLEKEKRKLREMKSL